MPALNKLSAAQIKFAPSGKYGDGGGLWLHKRNANDGKWLYLFKRGKQRREMGLGPYPAVSLKQAREQAERCRAQVRNGQDPITQREKERREAERNLHLLKDIARDAFESRKAELKGDGEAGRWFSPLEIHILPKLGEKPVSDIDQIDIRDTLSPIWHSKADTARKAINRLGICIRHAAALGLEVDMAAVDKAKALLGVQRHKTEHIPSLPWGEVPAFYQSLDNSTVSHLALRLLILTGVRSRPLRYLHLDQIDGAVWTIPGEIMKGRKDKTEDFRVPLSVEALRVVEFARPNARNGLLFASGKEVISDATMSRMMERRGMAARPHGFRSSLRVWLSEATDAPHDVAETMLGHLVGGSVERAYRRTDYLDQRAELAYRWSRFCTG